MEDLPLTGFGDTERKLIQVFVRHGREGRAITMESLAANAGMPGHSKELTTALRSLAARGLIIRAGTDPILARQSRFGFPGRYLCARIPSRRARQGHDLCWMIPLNELNLPRSQNGPLWAQTARSSPTAERVNPFARECQTSVSRTAR